MYAFQTLEPRTGWGICEFDIVDTARQHSSGTVARGKIVCPFPGGGYIAAEAEAGRLGQHLYCVIVKNQWQKPDKGEWQDIRRPKEYAHIPNREFRPARAAGEDDNSSHIAARLESNRERWDAENILPDELVPALGNKTDTLQHYDMPTWRNMFSPRRLLAHGCCVPAFRDLVDSDRDAGRMTDIRKAAWRCAAPALNKLISPARFKPQAAANAGERGNDKVTAAALATETTIARWTKSFASAAVFSSRTPA